MKIHKSVVTYVYIGIRT
jgi:hypothetical protein